MTRPRPLPIRIPPALNETVESYLGRLAATNYVHLDDVKLHLDIDPTLPIEVISHDNTSTLGTLTGYTPTELARALPELDRRHTNPAQFRRQPMPACPRCTSRHHGGPVTRYYPHHIRTCQKHRLWLGHQPNRRPNNRTFVDLSAMPTVLAAQTRHRRLALRRGIYITVHAFAYAHRIFTHTTQPATTRFPTGPTTSDDPQHQAAIYPDLVAITALLTSHYWREIAMEPHLGPAFLTAAGRIILGDRHFRPRHDHPLHAWSKDLAALQSEPDSVLSALARSIEP